jgi:hypothetical protein
VDLTGTVTFNMDMSNANGWYAGGEVIDSSLPNGGEIDSSLPIVSNSIVNLQLSSGKYSATLYSNGVSSSSASSAYFYFQNGAIVRWDIQLVSYDPGLVQLAPFGFSLVTANYQLYEGGTYQGDSVGDVLQVFYGAEASEAGVSGMWKRVGSSLFTTGSDTVDFNNLTSTQIASINGGADLYNALGGNDVVTLPNVANYQFTSSVTWTPSQTFTVGAASDTSANTDTVTGGDGNYNIAIVGPAIVNVTINGNGHSIITPGPGTLNATIGGGGTAELTSSATPATGSITFAAGTAGETLQIDGTTMPTNTIKGFMPGDTIDLAGVNYNASEFTQLIDWQNNELDIYANGTNGPNYKLQLDPSQNFYGYWFTLSSDRSNGTDIQLVPINSIAINVTLNGNGYGTLSATVNGQTIPGVQTPLYCAYDNLMPVPAGAYNVIYRTDAGKNSGDALEFDTQPGVSDFIDRTAIQLHIGNTPGDSNGCIVLGDGSVPPASSNSNAGSWTALTSFFDSVTSGTPYPHAPTPNFWQSPVPITVIVSGNDAQPTLEATPTYANLQNGLSDTIYFSIVDPQSNPVVPLDKNINVYFEILDANGNPIQDPSLVPGAQLTSVSLIPPSTPGYDKNVPLPGGGTYYAVTIKGTNQTSSSGAFSFPVTLNTSNVATSSLTIKIVYYDGITYFTRGTPYAYQPSGGTLGALQPMLENSRPVTITLISPKGSNTVNVGPNGSVLLGNGNDKVTAGAGSTITLGGGNDQVNAGPNSTITVGNGNDMVNAGDPSTIVVGDGNDKLTAGDGASITAGNGNDKISAGANATITIGNGNDFVNVGAGSVINLGSGHDHILFKTTGSSGTINETITGLSAKDTLDFTEIGFAAVEPPSFSGTATGGTLTITDGTHVANVNLIGDFLNSSWTVSSDGNGGTTLVDPPLLSPNVEGPTSSVCHEFLPTREHDLVSSAWTNDLLLHDETPNATTCDPRLHALVQAIAGFSSTDANMHSNAILWQNTDSITGISDFGAGNPGFSGSTVHHGSAWHVPT